MSPLQKINLKVTKFGMFYNCFYVLRHLCKRLA